jgi:hypothetical protein
MATDLQLDLTNVLLSYAAGHPSDDITPKTGLLASGSGSNDV